MTTRMYIREIKRFLKENIKLIAILSVIGAGLFFIFLNFAIGSNSNEQQNNLNSDQINDVSKRYAQALVELQNAGVITSDEILKDLKTISDTLKSSPDLNEVLSNPVIGIDDKKDIVDEIFKDSISLTVKNFVKVLIDKNRFSAFKYIVYAYEHELDLIKGLERVEVISAVEMKEDAKNRLKQKLEEKLKKSVMINFEQDAEIIAGLVIRIGDSVIDNSLRHKLEDLSKEMIK